MGVGDVSDLVIELDKKLLFDTQINSLVKRACRYIYK